MAVDYFTRIADVTDLPLILFQYPLAGGQGYPLATLTKIMDAVPTVRAIKDWCANPQLHERQIRVLQSRTPPVTVLTTHSAWLLSFAGARLQRPALRQRLGHRRPAGAALSRGAGERSRRARKLNDRIWPTAEVFYASPGSTCTTA